MKLTRRQKDILAYIQLYIEDYEYPPSVRDIASHFSLSSAGGVHKHLKNLEEKGIISLGKNISRSIRILRLPEEAEQKILRPPVEHSVVELPFKGHVAAGAPIQYFIENEFMEFPSSMVRKPDKTYVLKVIGNSMIEEYICDGDFVLVESRNWADNGETVIAMIDHSESTLKKFYLEKETVRLQPANSELKPIMVPVDKVSIQGVVAGVLRRYR